jgi:tetratricopeptide (TPR) repeat protein
MKLLPIIVLTENENVATESVLNDYTIEAYGLSEQVVNDFRKGIELCMQADEERLNVGSDPQPAIGTKVTTLPHLGERGEGLVAQAAACFKRCIDSAPQFAEAYYNYAYTLALQKKQADAIEQLTHALERKPQFAMAWFNRGLLYLFAENRQAAVSDLSKAGELGIYQAYSIIKQSRKK